MNGSVKANEVLLLGQEHTGKSTFLQRIVTIGQNIMLIF